MSNQLEALKQYTKVVADTGDFDSIKKFEPIDGTTNPSLILQAASLEKYKSLVLETITKANKKAHGLSMEKKIEKAMEELFVAFGAKILEIVKGRVSTEIDARLSYDTQATIAKGRELIKLYETEYKVPKERVLLKIAATWEGIEAAKVLEKEGIHCNITLLFCLAQAIAAAEAGVTLISPFVGRILDWYKKNGSETPKWYEDPKNDPGVESVMEIYNYYKKFGHKTTVMGASFRNKGEILALAGCDALTIAPSLLNELQSTKIEEGVNDLVPVLTAEEAKRADIKKIVMNEKVFRWELNADQMAYEKLGEGILKFAQDIEKLEKMVREMLEKMQ